MLVTGFPATAFGTNCYVIAPGPGEQCVIVDPGIGVTNRLEDVLAEHRLHPAAVVLTHGHLDHTFSVTPVCGAKGVTAYIHPDDKELLADPTKAISGIDPRTLLGGLEWSEPDDVAELSDGAVITLAGLEITVDHAPGHTQGSVMFRLPYGPSDASRRLSSAIPGTSELDAPEICLSGDVLFAGSIGRTDLPGGDTTQMMRSLREKVLPLDDAIAVLPGHGPATTIGAERRTNPFLLQLQEAAS